MKVDAVPVCGQGNFSTFGISGRLLRYVVEAFILSVGLISQIPDVAQLHKT